MTDPNKLLSVVWCMGLKEALHACLGESAVTTLLSGSIDCNGHENPSYFVGY